MYGIGFDENLLLYQKKCICSCLVCNPDFSFSELLLQISRKWLNPRKKEKHILKIQNLFCCVIVKFNPIKDFENSEVMALLL